MNVNNTSHYHVHGLQTLGWELTVCNALAPRESPCRRIVGQNKSYARLLYDFLGRFIDFPGIGHILEIGGGYGTVMECILRRHPCLKATMIDISPYLIGRQQERLRGYNVSYRREDFLETPPPTLLDIDAAIMNENMGDLPAVLDLDPEALLRPQTHTCKDAINEVRYFFTRYRLRLPDGPSFHVNLGALKAVEKLCHAGIPHIFLSEHSCEATVPEPFRPYVKLHPRGSPQRIALKGHDEYTIQFSYLARIAQDNGYEIARGPIADFIPVEMTARLRSRMSAPAAVTDEDEIIRHFMEDLYQYEYLLLTKAPRRRKVSC